MNDQKISYTIKWTQAYPTDYITIDLRNINKKLSENFEHSTVIEESLIDPNQQFLEARAVIKMIKEK